MSSTDRDPCLKEALTLDGRPSCASPFCDGRAKQIRKHGRYCSDHCRMDGYALRRAKALLNKVGTVEFRRLLDRA
jgi:hypothetical protein